jgi:hypothetical protein
MDTYSSYTWSNNTYFKFVAFISRVGRVAVKIVDFQ